MENFENKIEREKGANVELVLHVLRHGDRTPDGYLEEYGRERTRSVANEKVRDYPDDIKVKAFGSPAGPKSEETGMSRSTETADIFAREISLQKDDAGLYKTRSRSLLNYEDWDVLTVDPEYDYMEIFSNALNSYVEEHHPGKKYDELSKEEQETASFYASNKATEYYMELDTEQAEQSRKEIAGTFALLIKRYIKMMRERLDSNQKLLFPLGSHTGTIEPFLSKVVIWKDEDGKERHGATLKEIGGIFKPSEGFDIILKTNHNGEPEQVHVLFDDRSRLGGEVYLDMQKVDEFAEFYRELHKKDEESEQK